MIKKWIMEKAKTCGADLCGFAPVERFDNAPPDFHPRDIFQHCRTVVVLAKRLPSGLIESDTAVPYTYFNQITTQMLDGITLQLAVLLEEKGIHSIPVPSDDPYDFWNDEQQRGKGILSLRHAGYLAGLGLMGRNTLLTTATFGNMVRLSALLVDTSINGDTVMEGAFCPPECRICIDRCPGNALDGVTVVQKQCRLHAYVTAGRNFKLMQCYECRRACPFSDGFDLSKISAEA